MPIQLATRRFVPGNNRELESLTRYLADPVDQLLQIPILNGRLLEGIILAPAVPLRIEHKLARPFRGWFVVRMDTGATVFESNLPDPLPGQFLILDTTTNVTVSLWVF